MRIYILSIFFTLLTIFSCNNKDVYLSYGGKIDLTDKSLFVSSIDNNYNISNIEGQIIDVCPKKGCWMNVKIDQDTIFVKFRDYAFFVPKSGVQGKKVFVSGDIFRDTISVERLRHYAEDAKKSKKEILAITQPEYKINMIADAVAIKEN
mgnify:CR=1 FL=1|tara:strand:- start:137 stop:586 length:450 start_codon:yes stop_codon:yes gene_type:complete